MNISFTRHLEKKTGSVEDVFLKVRYQCFSAHKGGMGKVAKVKNEKVHIISILKNGEEKEEAILSNARKKEKTNV